jgi:hypothetical protein
MDKPQFIIPVFSWLVAVVVFAPWAMSAGDVASGTEREEIGCDLHIYEQLISKCVEAGDKALKVKDYETAWADYKKAADLMPAPRFAAPYGYVMDTFCNVTCQLAELLVSEEGYVDAVTLLHIVF